MYVRILIMSPFARSPDTQLDVTTLAMGVHNTTGANTLFIVLSALIALGCYAVYRATVGSDESREDRTSDGDMLLRPGAWFAVDISIVLNAMTRGRGLTAFTRMQQCAPPMPAKKQVFSYMDSWCVGVLVSMCGYLVLSADMHTCACHVVLQVQITQVLRLHFNFCIRRPPMPIQKEKPRGNREKTTLHCRKGDRENTHRLGESVEAIGDNRHRCVVLGKEVGHHSKIIRQNKIVWGTVRG